MDAILDFLSSDNFKYIFPIIFGIIASWFISKYFFFKKKPSKIDDSRRFKTADFGTYRNVTKETDSTILETNYFGTWHINGNGTVTDTKNKLTWIRAPWGTTWNGEDFVGNPIPIKWREAAELFGKGISVKKPFPTLTLEQRPTNFKENYTKGSCKVTFADYDTWRLPTAAECDALQFYVPLDMDHDLYKLHDQERLTLRAQLFPFLVAFSKQNNLKYKLWSADIADVHSAWTHHGSTSLDDTKTDNLCYVLFVKNL